MAAELISSFVKANTEISTFVLPVGKDDREVKR